jgi:protein TonB
MNKFIILPCFIIVVSLHVLFFLYYRNNEIILSKPNKNNSTQVQVQLTKVREIVKEQIIEKPLQEKELTKDLIKTTNKPSIKKIQKTTKKESKVEIKQSPTIVEDIVETIEEKATTKIESVEKINPPINYQEEKYIDNYASRLREEINKNKNYPTISKKLREEGRVIVSFRVLNTGQFTNIRVFVSSTKERLDKAALNALYNTKEYQAFDNKLINKEFLDFELPLEFKLN